jgi:hypothetical protein
MTRLADIAALALLLALLPLVALIAAGFALRLGFIWIEEILK